MEDTSESLESSPTPESAFLSKTTFSAHIEDMVHHSGYTYFDAILAFADEADKDPDELTQYMTPVLIEKIKRSAISEGYFQGPTSTELDVFE